MSQQAATLALQPLQQALALQLQQLAQALQRKLGGRSPPTMAELVSLNLLLCRLHHWLPAQDAQRLPLDKLQRLLPALLQPQEPAAQARLLAFVLQLLQSLPDSRWVALRQGAAVNAHTLPLLVTLWRWQQQAQSNDIGHMVAPVVQQLLRQIVTAVRGRPHSAELASLWWRLQALAMVAGLQSATLARLIRQLSLAQVCPWLIDNDQQCALWRDLWRWSQQQTLATPPAFDCEDLELLQAVQADLLALRWQLQQFLQGVDADTRVPFAILLQFYRLPWIVAAAGHDALADYFHLWHHCLLQWWRPQLPLPPTALILLQQVVPLLDITHWSRCGGEQLLHQHLQLLALLPASSESARPAESLADMLAQAFTTLLQVQAYWFCDEAAMQPHAATLLGELRQLEQAAAALRLPPIESVASLLLAFHSQLQRSFGAQAWPNELLWRAHRHVLDLLDEAAAWQQTQADTVLISDIRHWLHQARHSEFGVREPAPASVAPELSVRLHRFVDALAQALDQPVHFHATVPALLPVQTGTCEKVLQPLLRNEVLMQMQAGSQRRLAGKPRAIALQLQLVVGEEGVGVELLVEGADLAYDKSTLQRLRRSLPSVVQRLDCTGVQGRGRRLQLLIGC